MPSPIELCLRIGRVINIAYQRLPHDGWQEALALPRLAIDKDFLDDYSKLEKSVRTAVKEAIEKFAEHTYAGLHLEKLQKSVDDRIRTIRIDSFGAVSSLPQTAVTPIT